MRYTCAILVVVFLGVGFSEGAVVPTMDSSPVSQVDFSDLEKTDTVEAETAKIPMAPREAPTSRRVLKIPRRLAESDWEEVSPADSIEYYRKQRDRFKKSGSRRNGTGTVFLTTGAALLVTGGLFAMRGHYSHVEWEADCGKNTYDESYKCHNLKEEKDLYVFFAKVSAVAGVAFVGGGIGFKSSGSARLRKASLYHKRLRYWEDVERQDAQVSEEPLSGAELRWLPIYDPLRGRAGTLLAISF